MAATNETQLTGNDSTTAISYPGGTGTMSVHDRGGDGAFGSGTVALEFSPDNGSNWYTVNDVNGNAAELTANGHVLFNIFQCQLRATMSGGTDSDVSVSISGHYYPSAT